MEDGYGRAQKHVQRQLAKRFYKKAGIKSNENGFSITLDGRDTKTPGKTAILVPVEALALAMAAEWEAQETEIDPDKMPLVRLVNSAIEAGEGSEPALKAEIVKYAGSDLLLYRAETPRELVNAQEAEWDRVLANIARHFNVKFLPTTGIIHKTQLAETLSRLSNTLEQIDLFTLIALNSITSLTGSGLLAIALQTKLISADEAWKAAHVDEDFSAKIWGDDGEAEARRALRRKEYDAALSLMELVG